jgi:hypothetical protein
MLLLQILPHVVILMVAIFMFQRYFSTPSPPLPPAPTNEAGEVEQRYTIHESLGKTGRIVIRLPVSPGEPPEQIVVAYWAPDEFTVSRSSLSDTGIFGDNFTRRDVTSAEWAALDAMRTEWCADRPRFREPNEGELFYEVKIKCGDGPGTRYAQIPEDELPTALADLIANMPPREPCDCATPTPEASARPSVTPE